MQPSPSTAVLQPAHLMELERTPAAVATSRLLAMQAEVASCAEPTVLAAMAAAIPASVASLPDEIGMALHNLAATLVAHQPRIPNDIMALTPKLQVAWIRLQLTLGDLSQLSELQPSRQLQVLSSWSLASAADPIGVLTMLIASPDARVHSHVLMALPSLVEELALTGRDALVLAMQLASDANVAVRTAAIQSLGQPWLLNATYQQCRLRDQLLAAAIAEPQLSVALAGVAALGKLQNRALLLQVLHAPQSAPAVIKLAIELLGTCAESNDIELVVAVVNQDVLCYGDSARRFLLDAHRHGIFVKAPQLRDVMALFESHLGWTAEEFVRITHTERHELLAMLAAMAPDDPRWLRWCEVLALGITAGSAAALAGLLARTTTPAIAAAALVAAGKCPSFDDEAVLLQWLPQLPEETIATLRVKGQQAAYEQLTQLVEDRWTPSTLRTQALPVLWALAPDRAALMQQLSTTLGPRESGLMNYHAYKYSPTARLLAAQDWPASNDNVVAAQDQLRLLCESGDVAVIDDVARLFREVFRSYVAQALQGDFSIKRQKLPEVEQLICEYGQRLVADGRIVRGWHEAANATGRDLVLRFIAEWLAERPSEAVQVALLEACARHRPEGFRLRQIETYWRQGTVNVRRAAVAALAAAGDEARGLEFSLASLVGDAKDARLQAQALEAVQALVATWAEPITHAALESPNMAVKIAAADALAVMGNAHSVATIVGWLGRHDNKQFRSALLKALKHCAGPLYCAVLVDALEVNADHSNDPRTAGLLHAALSHHLSIAAALRLSRSAKPVHTAVVTNCVDHTIVLSDATADDLAAALHLARRAIPTTSQDAGRELRLSGFSIAAAQRLVTQWDPRAAQRASATSAKSVVRSQLGSWISWLQADAVIPALQLALHAAEPADIEHVDNLIKLLADHLPSVDAAVVCEFVERCVVGSRMSAPTIRSIDLVRNIPAVPTLGGLRRYSLLGRLGAIRNVRDVQQALTDCRLSSDVATQSATLLRDVLSIPPKRDDEPAAITELRNFAENWFRTSDLTAPWLLAALDDRPPDMMVVPDVEMPAHQAAPPSATQLASLLAALVAPNADVRAQAAQQMLDWPDAQTSWHLVGNAYLANEIDLPVGYLGRVAETVKQWPIDATPATTRRLVSLVPWLSSVQLQGYVPRWISERSRGSANADLFLQAVRDDRLLPFIVACARRGDFSAAQLLRPSNTLTHRGLVELAHQGGVDLSHLLKVEEHETERQQQDPADPIMGATLDQLVAIAQDKVNKPGIAVRAVYAIASHGAPSIPALQSLAVDHRPAVRSAALRALKTVASKEATLRTAVEVLAMEDRDDVVVSLLRSLGHGRYEPTLLAIIERVTERNPKVREAARAALLAWGAGAMPAIHQAARKARPDRRAHFETLLAELDPNGDGGPRPRR